MVMKGDEVGSECCACGLSRFVCLLSGKGETLMNQGEVEKRRETVLLEMIIIIVAACRCLPRYVRIWLVTLPRAQQISWTFMTSFYVP